MGQGLGLKGQSFLAQWAKRPRVRFVGQVAGLFGVSQGHSGSSDLGQQPSGEKPPQPGPAAARWGREVGGVLCR